LIRTLCTLLKIWRLWAWTPPEPVQHAVTVHPEGAVDLTLHIDGLVTPWTERVHEWPGPDYLYHLEREAEILIEMHHQAERPDALIPGWMGPTIDLTRAGRDQ
jgi:hypothetical protein